LRWDVCGLVSLMCGVRVERGIGRSVRMNLCKVNGLGCVLANILGYIVRNVGRVVRRMVTLCHDGAILAHIFSHIYAMVSFFGQILSFVASLIFLNHMGLIC
jgi:hypothetical protein